MVADYERRGQGDHRLPTRSESGHADDDDMRSVRADDAGRNGLDPIEDDAGDADALRSSYAARIAAARLTMPAQDRRAAIKALRAEQKATMRELTQRRQERQKARRDAARLRAPPPPPKPRK